MLRKTIRISKWFLAGVLIYAAFISVLYLRMKNAENMLADYYESPSCPSSNCRETIEAKLLDYGSEKISFTNYGSRGLPLESGTFEEYLFTLSIGDSEPKTVKVLPDTPLDISGFDVENTYIPTKSDKTLVNSNLFDGKIVLVEVWRNRVTFILVSLPVSDQTSGTSPQEGVSIGPKEQEAYEVAIPTENHPAVLAELAKKDFNGWTGGILLLVVSPVIFGSVVIGFFYGTDWIIRKIVERKSKKTTKTTR